MGSEQRRALQGRAQAAGARVMGSVTSVLGRPLGEERTLRPAPRGLGGGAEALCEKRSELWSLASRSGPRPPKL